MNCKKNRDGLIPYTEKELNLPETSKDLMTKEEWYRQLFERLANSKFRSSFHLKQKNNDYINEKGIGDVVDGN